MKPFATVVVAALLGVTPIPAATPQFGGEKTTWHGFDRYDFLMDKADLAIKPHKASPDERTAVRTQVKGQLRCVVVAPKKPTAGAASLSYVRSCWPLEMLKPVEELPPGLFPEEGKSVGTVSSGDGADYCS